MESLLCAASRSAAAKIGFQRAAGTGGCSFGFKPDAVEIRGCMRDREVNKQLLQLL